MTRRVCIWGVCIRGGSASRRVCMVGQTHPPPGILRVTVNERALRILMECILVVNLIYNYIYKINSWLICNVLTQGLYSPILARGVFMLATLVHLSSIGSYLIALFNTTFSLLNPPTIETELFPTFNIYLILIKKLQKYILKF